jgi:drug/metabolite transporter (DMT)-like permease
MNILLVILCIILWGTSTFLNRLSVERISPVLQQVIVGFMYFIYIPIALKISGISNPFTYKWSHYSVGLTILATIFSIGAHIILYMNLKGSSSTGASVMLVSMYPIVNLILSVLILHEQFTWLKIAGVITMVVGAFMLSMK